MCGKLLLVSALLVGLLSGISFGGDLNQTKNDVIDLINKGQTEAASKSINQIISDYSQDSFLPEALYWIAWSYGWTGRYNEEQNLYQQIIQKYPDNTIVNSARMCYLGSEIQAFIAAQKFDEAKTALNKLAADFYSLPDLPQMLYRIARSYEWSQDNQYEDSKEIFRRIIQFTSDEKLKGKAQLGAARTEILALIKQGMYKESRESYAKLIEEFAENADLADTLYWIANRYGYANRYEEEKNVYQELLEKYPENNNTVNAQFGFNKAQIHSLIALDRIEDSNSALNKFVADYNNHPDMPEALYWIARRYEWNVNYAQAANIFGLILQEYPKNKIENKVQTGIERTSICLKIVSDETESLQADTENVIANFINNPELLETMEEIGRRYEWADKYEEAKIIYQRIIDIQPESNFSDKAEIDLASLDTLIAISSLDYNETKIGIDELIADYNESPYLAETLLFIAEKCYDTCYDFAIKNEACRKLLQLSAQILDERVLNKIQDTDNKTLAYYLAAVVNSRLGNIDKTMEYADKLLQIAPEFIHAASMQLMIADGFEKLKASGQLPAAEADLIIEEEYKNLMDNYTNGLNNYAALHLGEIFIKQERITEACACFGLYLMNTGLDGCGAVRINRIFEQCGRCKK
ncbi:MAG: tetratricopeptide repeat protein [Phycisphaerae bacterium]|jgi:tetratricopeptide (TPR) repeat protein